MGLDERPPGDPDGIKRLADWWTARSTDATSAADTLGAAAKDISGGELRLKGDFAPEIAQAIGSLPDGLRKLARGYQSCASVLGSYADTLRSTQSTWDRHNIDRNAYLEQVRQAERDLDRISPGWDSTGQNVLNMLPGSVGEVDQTPEFQAAFRRRSTAQNEAELREKWANDARRLRDEAVDKTVHDLDRALDKNGLRNLSWLQKGLNHLHAAFTDWDKFVELCEQLSMVLGVIAIFASGPFALIVGAALMAMTAVSLADKAKKYLNGELTWQDALMAMGMAALNRVGGKLFMKGFKALQKTKLGTAVSKRFQSGAQNPRNSAHRDACSSTGHPVDIATGKVFTSFTDLELPGPLPFRLDRVWFSTSDYVGPFGYGWHHTFDDALLVTDQFAIWRTPDGRHVDLLPLDVGHDYYDRAERVTVSRDQVGFRLRSSDGVTRRYTPLTNEFEADGETVTYVLRDVTSRAGHRISCRYDDAGRLASIQDSGGRLIGFDYDDLNRIIALTAPHPDLVDERFAVGRYAYDEVGNLLSLTDSRDHVFRYGYMGHLLTTETDRTGLTFTFEYDRLDSAGKCVRTWGDGNLYARELVYEPGQTLVTNSLGHVTIYEHEHGQVWRTTDPVGAVTTITYHERQPVEQIDPLGRVTQFEYDWRGNLMNTTTPDGVTVALRFDDADLPVEATDAVGGHWAWSYDEAGLLTQRRDPLGRLTELAYSGGLLDRITDPAGGQTRLTYDDQASLIELTTPDDAHTRWRRNLLGWPVATVDPLGAEVRRSFDLAGNIVRVEEPDGNIRTLGYDGEGNTTSAVDVLYDVAMTYQGMGRLATRTQADTTVEFRYDTEEQLTGVVNEHGYVYSFTYNPAGLVSTERGFDAIMRIYERDIAGRVATVRRASGLVTRHLYDDVDRVVAIEHSDGTAQRYTYRADGALLGAVNAATDYTIEVRFERDVLGRLTREWQGDQWVASQYDLLDNRIRMTSSMGADQRITRNLMGDVMAVEGNGYSARFARDALGQELARELPGGVVARWHRDAIGRPVRQEITGLQGTIRQRDYEWVAGGRLRGIADSLTGPIRYEHDGLGQLVSATYGDGTMEVRMPDALGNLFRTRERSDREYGPAGQVLSLVDDIGRRVVYEYDPEGNLIRKTTGDGGEWEYRWAADGNLASILRPCRDEVVFTYDALSRRISKSFRGRTVCWVWDGDAMLHHCTGKELKAAGRRAQGASCERAAEAPGAWLVAPRFLMPFAYVTERRSASFIGDHLDTPYVMTDMTGCVVWLNASHVCHGPFSGADENATPLFRDAGLQADSETKLRYHRHRYLDVESGCFISQDPIRLHGGRNLVGYTRDPTISTDPLGLEVVPGVIEDKTPVRVYRFHDASDKGSLRPHPAGYQSTNLPQGMAPLQRAKHHMEEGITGGSGFVSVTTDPSAVLKSDDPNLRSIARRTPNLSEFVVPRDNLVFAAPDTIPFFDKEAVFYGENLDQYHVSTRRNPHCGGIGS